MRKIKILVSVLFVCLLVFGSAQRSSKTDIATMFNDLMLPNEGALFRGVDFDFSEDQVSKIEKARTGVTEYDSDYEDEFLVEVQMGSNEDDYAEISYYFDEMGLYSIYVETYNVSKDAADQIYEKVESYYSSTIGEGVYAEDGFIEFYGYNGTYDYVVSISKVDIEDDYGMYIYIDLTDGYGVDDVEDASDYYEEDYEEEDPNILFNDLLEPDAGGIYRGVDFDWTKEQVLTIEQRRSTVDVYVDDEPKELIITTDMGTHVMNFADVTYSFDENGLYSIEVETYVETEKASDDVYDLVKDYYTKKFGEGTVVYDGYLEFYGNNGEYDYVVAISKIEDLIGSYGMYIYIDFEGNYIVPEIEDDLDYYYEEDYEEEDPTILFNDLVEPDAGGIFRGVSFDWTKEQVKTLELKRSTTDIYTDELDEELVVTTDMGAEAMNFADVSYFFDDKGLYSIEAETYSVTQEITDDVYAKVKDYYTNKLGAGTLAEDGYLEFKGSYKSYKYTVAMQKLDYEDSPGLMLYLYID
ncbi:MAG: hypothetical protein LRY27_02745 [Chitinophagales bacterium]|nr:hypothetical protein [Chitinophagales bacterium]